MATQFSRLRVGQQRRIETYSLASLDAVQACAGLRLTPLQLRSDRQLMMLPAPFSRCRMRSSHVIGVGRVGCPVWHMAQQRSRWCPGKRARRVGAFWCLLAWRAAGIGELWQWIRAERGVAPCSAACCLHVR